MGWNNDKVLVVIEDTNTPDNVRRFLAEYGQANTYLDSVSVDDNGNVTRNDYNQRATEVNAEATTGQATAPAEVPAAEPGQPTETAAVPTVADNDNAEAERVNPPGEGSPSGSA